MTNNEIIKFLQSKQIPQCGDKVYTADEEYEAYQRAIDAVEQQPSDTVSRGAFEQVMWERNVAIGQLKELGYELGQKVEACDDAISRYAVIKGIEELKKSPWATDKRGNGFEYLITEALDVVKDLCVKQLPSVTQKSGKWVDREEYDADRWMCSECGRTEQYQEKFCPNCGCRMVEPQESEDKE